MVSSVSARPLPSSLAPILARVIVLAVGVSGLSGIIACPGAVADDSSSSWSSAWSSAWTVQQHLPRHPTLLWREDPRPAADTPGGVEVPSGRRVPRRVQRRIVRRRPTPDTQSAAQPDALPFDLRTQMDRRPQMPLDPIEPRGMPDGIDLEPFLPTPVVAPAAAPIPAVASGITTHRDQPYGSGPEGRPAHGRQRFDIHLPAGCNAGGMPLVVWIHGAAWRDGSKADCPIVWLANEGYAVASIGYRLSDTAVFPAQLDDCRAAIAEIERHADVWGIDPERVAVVGSGGGGHLAALVGLAGQSATPGVPAADASGVADREDAHKDAQKDALDEPAPLHIAAVCAVAAPASLTTLGPEQDRAGSPASRLVGGPLPEFREAAQRASPVSHISADDPPVLLLHGAADATIPVSQSVAFATALKAAGVDATLVVIPGAGHGPDLRLSMPAGQALLSFLDRVLGPGVRPDLAPQP